MSSSKKQTLEARQRNYSFSSNQQQQYQIAERERVLRQPLKETDIFQNYSPTRFQNDQLNKISLYGSDLEPIPPTLVELHQEDEIRKLEEVIYYLTGDRDLLKDQCAALQVELGTVTVSFSREKEVFEAEIRKLKEIIKDKESECESISKTLKKQKEIFQQQNERMNYQLKMTIEKKTDQIYAVSREKEMENQQTRRSLEAIIEELKANHKKELSEKDNIVPSLIAEINEWKNKYSDIQSELASINEKYSAEKFRLAEEYDLLIAKLKEGQYKAKIQILQANKDIVKALQENSEIQRSAFLLQIDHLRQALKRSQADNQQLQGIIFEANRAHNDSINGYLNLISELQNKLQVIHRQKQKQIQFMKIKTANLHSNDLQSAEEIFKTQLSRYVDQLNTVQAEKKRLINVIDQQKNKSKGLIFQLKERDSRFYEQLFNLRLKNSQNIEDLKRKYQKEKAVILQQNVQARKEAESTSTQIQFQQEQLKKLRKILDNRGREVEQLQKQIIKVKGQIKDERSRYTDELNTRQRLWSQQRDKLQQEIDIKNKQIQRLNNALLEAFEEEQSHHYVQLQKQIKLLRQKLKTVTQEGKQWKNKVESLNQSVDQLTVQKELLKAQIGKDSAETQKYWQDKCKEKIKDLQKFYQRKIQFLNVEKEQLQSYREQQAHSYAELQRKYNEVDNNFQELLSTARKLTELQQKVVKLGLDRNLVKNKQQLFEY